MFCVLYPSVAHLLSLPRNKAIAFVHARMLYFRNTKQIYMKFDTRSQHEKLRECNFNPFRLNTNPHFAEAQIKRLNLKKRLLVRNTPLAQTWNIDIVKLYNMYLNHFVCRPARM
jgi:hypothetical protein